MEEKVILVDEDDSQIGTEEKLTAHKKSLLHRALSVWVFNSKGETLLQKRARGKYHSGGLWSNTCCGHPRPGEDVGDAAKRRLFEEMGVECPMEETFTLLYKKEVGNELWESEYLHVFIGKFDGTPLINEEEAGDYRWVNLDDLKRDIGENNERYTTWLPIVSDKISVPK